MKKCKQCKFTVAKQEKSPSNTANLKIIFKNLKIKIMRIFLINHLKNICNILIKSTWL